MTGPDDSPEGDDDASDAFDSGREEREAHYPDAGYNLVAIDMTRPPGEALILRGHHPTLSRITMPPATEFEEYVVYDRHGNASDHDEEVRHAAAVAIDEIASGG